jgi:hypothetical protein
MIWKICRKLTSFVKRLSDKPMKKFWTEQKSARNRELDDLRTRIQGKVALRRTLYQMGFESPVAQFWEFIFTQRQKARRMDEVQIIGELKLVSSGIVLSKLRAVSTNDDDFTIANNECFMEKFWAEQKASRKSELDMLIATIQGKVALRRTLYQMGLDSPVAQFSRRTDELKNIRELKLVSSSHLLLTIK